jgi:hypothetical protein
MSSATILLLPEIIKTKAHKYDEIINKRKESIKKYHNSQKGIDSRLRASKKYYSLHKQKILETKRLKYANAKATRTAQSNN